MPLARGDGSEHHRAILKATAGHPFGLAPAPLTRKPRRRGGGGWPPIFMQIRARSHSPHLTPRQKPLARLTHPRPPRTCVGAHPCRGCPHGLTSKPTPVHGRKRTGSTRTLTHTAEPAQHIRRRAPTAAIPTQAFTHVTAAPMPASVTGSQRPAGL